MASVDLKQIDGLKQLLSEYHSAHQEQYGPMDGCQEASCVEAKLGLRYLGNKLPPSQESGPSSFNLK
jgi:hypothetical protein